MSDVDAEGGGDRQERNSSLRIDRPVTQTGSGREEGQVHPSGVGHTLGMEEPPNSWWTDKKGITPSPVTVTEGPRRVSDAGTRFQSTHPSRVPIGTTCGPRRQGVDGPRDGLGTSDLRMGESQSKEDCVPVARSSRFTFGSLRTPVLGLACIILEVV